MTEEESRLRPMLVECPYCEKPVLGEPRGQLFHYDPHEGPPERWTLLECAENGHALLVLQNDFGAPMSFDDDRPWRAYPPQDRPLSLQIPEPLRQIHDEARACFRVKAYTAAAVMCGRTLEGACALHGVKERNLQASLVKMKARELIDGRLWEWAETLRDVRNAAAHFSGDAITKQDAEDLIAYDEALLDYLYVLNARFTALKARRAKGKSDKGSGETGSA